MTSDRAPFRTPRLALRLARRGGRGARLAFFVAMLAQLFAGVVVPVAHAKLARPLAAHIDLPGSVHDTHDEASCAPCASSHVLGRVERASTVLPMRAGPHATAAAYATRVVAAQFVRTKSPRAPPVSV